MIVDHKRSRGRSSPPVLHFPDYSREFIVHVDASEAGVGAFLAQNANEGSDKPDLQIIVLHV